MTEFISSISSLNALIQNIQSNQIQANKVGQQVSTGYVSPNLADIPNNTELLSLTQTQSQDNYYVDAINVSLTKANAIDAALTRIGNDITSLNSAIEQFGPGAVTPSNTAIAQQVQEAASDLTAALNTSQGGVYLFAGSNYSQIPVSATGLLQGGGAAINNILNNVGGVPAGSAPATIAAVGTAANTGPPGGPTAYPVTAGNQLVPDYASQFTSYGANDDPNNLAFTNQSVTVENQRTITYGITANQSMFQDLSNALRAASIGSQTPPPTVGGVPLTAAQQAAWLQLAATSLTAIQTQVGTAQSLLGLQRNDMQTTANNLTTDSGNLQISISQIQSVDQAKSSTDLLSVQSQFQASLSVTKTILGLSLANYLGTTG